MRILISTVFLATFAASALADIVELKNGKAYSGKVLLYDGQQIKLANGDKIDTINIADVAALRFGDRAVAAAQPALSAPIDTRSDQIKIPPRTIIGVRTIDAIDSKTARAGQTFLASLADPLEVDGVSLAPVGADVILKLISSKQAGRVKGSAALTISLAQVRVGTQMVDVNSENVTSTGAGKGKGTATKGGVGAAVGAVIGGIAGGGAGAAIGAAAGGAVGVGVSMAMKGPRVVIPSETRLSFTIQ